MPLPMQGDTGSVPVKEDSTRRGAVALGSRVHVPDYWSPHTWTPLIYHEKPQQRAAHATTAKSRPLTVIRESPHAATETQHSQ